MKKLIEKHRDEIEKTIGKFEITNDEFYGLVTIITGEDDTSYDERYAIGTDSECEKALNDYLAEFTDESLKHFIDEEYISFFDFEKWKKYKHSRRGESFPNIDNNEIKIGKFYLYALDY